MRASKDGLKRCSSCKERLAPTPELYGRDKHSKDGLTHRCKACQRVRNREWSEANPAQKMWFAARTRAAKRGAPFTITVLDVSLWLTEAACAYCTQSTVNRSGHGVTNGALSYSTTLDCIDPELGYTKENVVACCFACNMSKSNMSYRSWRTHILRLAQQMSMRPEAPNSGD